MGGWIYMTGLVVSAHFAKVHKNGDDDDDNIELLLLLLLLLLIIIIGESRTILKPFRKYLSTIMGSHKIKFN